MQRILLITILSLGMWNSILSQVQNVNISGSFSGTFLLSGNVEDYNVLGSPYLSETWMYGTLELKKDIVEMAKTEKKVNKQMKQYQEKIREIDVLIEKLSDPELDAVGLSLSMAESDTKLEASPLEVSISNEEYLGFSGITNNLHEELLFYFEQLKSEYESQINNMYKINGLLRYNLYNQEFEMIYGKDTFSIVSPFDLNSITVSNKKFIHGLYVERLNSRVKLGSSYFEILSDGKCKLLLRHSVKIKSGSAPITFGWAGSEDFFYQMQHFFYQKEEGTEVLPLKLRKKEILNLFEERQDEIASFIKSERINLHDKTLLIKVFDHYNNL